MREGPEIRQELDRLFATLRDGDAKLDAHEEITDIPKAATPTRKALKHVDRKRGAAKIKPRVRFVAPQINMTNTKPLAESISTKTKKTMVDKTNTAAKAVTPRTPRVVKTTRITKKINTKTQKNQRHVMTSSQFDRQLPASIKWSPWHLAMSITDGPAGDRIQHTCKVFQKSQSQPAVYEVSVQTEKQKKYRVMYCCHSAGVRGELINRLLKSSRRVQKEIQNVLDQNCKVFIRRFVVKTHVTIDGQEKKTVRKIKNVLLKKFDYAWNRSERNLICVRKSGKLISTGTNV